MNTRRKTVACVAVLLALVPAAAKESDTAQRMRTSAAAFLAALDEGQRAQATFAFDADERLNWHFVPIERKGLPLKSMTPAQRQAVVTLLKSGLSDKGFEKAERIRSLENVLIEIEKGKGPVRDPERYFVSIFGTPSADKPWGWRYEGHHIALNFTVIGGSAIASSPNFFGANPAEVRIDGPLKGLRALAAEEDLARTFVTSLDPTQRTAAVVAPEAPRDILTGDKREIGPLDSAGVAYSALTGGQQKILMQLVEQHAFGHTKTLGDARMAAIRKAGLDAIHMAWLGPIEKGAKHYYRVQGPTFLVEYDNTQNDGNHVHTVWRDFKGDFGRDLLSEHYRQDHQPAAVADQD